MPEWIYHEVTLERLARTMQELEGKASDDYATDIETFAYLFTASLRAPMDDTYYSIYAYLFSKYTQKRGIESPFGEDRELTEYESQALRELKRLIRSQQKRTRQKTNL